jgi:sigma-E factor negative regulatory protein RseB
MRIPPQWQVTDLPPGFALTRTQKPKRSDDRTEHQIYSDGLASVSVYVEPHAGAVGADRGFARGMLNVFTHESDGWRVAAIGDVPRATLERMVRSTRPVSAGR